MTARNRNGAIALVVLVWLAALAVVEAELATRRAARAAARPRATLETDNSDPCAYKVW